MNSEYQTPIKTFMDALENHCECYNTESTKIISSKSTGLDITWMSCDSLHALF